MNSGLLLTQLKIAFRNLSKYRFYSLINLLGLALGLAACLLVFAYTRYESSYDQDHPHVERLYRVNQTNIWSPEGGVMASTAPPLGAVLADHYPEVEAATRINTPGTQLIRYEQADGTVTAFNETEVLAADSNFFDFFAFELQEGNPATALQGVGKVVLSDKAAKKYFGDRPALGEILELGEERQPVTVSGVTLSQPGNRHFNFDLLLSMPTNPNVEQMDWSWIWTQMATYVRLKPGASAELLEDKLAGVAKQFVAPSFGRLGMDFGDFMKEKGSWDFYLQPVRDIHLYSADIGNRLGTVGDIAVVRLLRLIALLILLIAVLNFVNLSTARASTRAKEIGVKKLMGARRNGLVRQFLVESILVSTLATFLALGLMQVLQLAIAGLAGIDIPVHYLAEPGQWPLLLLLPVAVGALAGLYPALYLSGFQPLQVLQGKVSGGMKAPLLRNILVTAQFTISIALMAGTVLIYQQLKFMENKNLGFNQENVLILNQAERLGHQMESFRNEVQQLPEVISASLAMNVPGRGTYEDLFSREGSEIQLSISQNKIDAQYFQTMGLELAAGRAFEPGRSADQNGLIINETTARLFEWGNEEALGQRIVYPENPDLKVIGVVKDFHFQSLRQPIAPMMFFHLDADMWGDQRVLTIKYKQRNEEQLLTKLENQWERVTNDIPFDYSFFDAEMAQQYAQERSLSGLVTLFSGFSVFIAVIGLLGLLSFSTEQRKKEISIRKVLGASRLQLFALLNRQYFRLFVLALLLAIPLSWQSLQEWLNSFAYRTDVNLFIYALAGLIVLLLSIGSVSYLSVKIASTNPAEVLKDE